MSSVNPPDGGYSYYQKPLADLEREMRDEGQRTRDRYEERVDSLEKNYKDSIARRDQDIKETVQNLRDNASESHARDREYSKARIDELKAETYDKFGRARKEIAYNQKRAEEAIQQKIEEFDRREEKLKDSASASSDKVAHAAKDRLSQNALEENRSRQRESAQLRESIKDLLAHDKLYGKEKGQGTLDARREVEGEARAREQVIQRQYGSEIEGLKQKSDNTERYLARLNDENIRDREIVHAKRIQGMNQDRQDNEAFLRQNSINAIEQQKDINRKLIARSEERIEKQAESLGKEYGKAMENQARTLQEQNRNQKLEDTYRIDRLEKRLHDQMTSADGTWISPAAEAAMRDGFTQEYESKHKAEVQRNKDKTDSLHKTYSERLSNTVQDAEHRITDVELQRRSDEHMQKQSFLAHIDEVQQSKEMELRNKDYESDRHSESLNRLFSQTIERQRRDYESMIQQIKTDSDVKITNLRQKADFDSKMAQRNFAAQQSELIRNQERKLSEQRNEFEDQIATLREQLSTANREADRRAKQLLEDQGKNYEQKIAQLEFQSKDRERTISDNYQDQIEKLKRSNALLIQRKSEKS